ncbi:MAG: hypothetical protein HFI20_03940 [Lachnospiraceae bacterium]|nr:hypothetical protein [Lachnospiraceae bacterium]
MKQEEKFLQEAKYSAKASVFTDLFKIPKHLLQLYQALHPEDKDSTEDSIRNVTIKNVFLDQPYNDLGFQIGEKLVVLVEAQSNWTVNIIVRSLLYLAQTYQEYIESTGQNVYTSKRLNLPQPELYVIYTGERKIRPEYLYLSEEFFGGAKCAVEVKVKMIYNGEKGDIINQYVTFTKIYNDQIRLHGRTRKAVWETIHICKNQDVLKEYLENREKEVVDIMMTLFDDEYILRTYIASEVKEASEKAAKEAAKKAAKEATEKAAKEAAKEAVEKAMSAAKKLYEKGSSVEDIAEVLDIPVEKIKQWLGVVQV